MVTTFCISGACLLKAGANVSGIFTDATGAFGLSSHLLWEELIHQAESFLNTQTRINYTDTYAALSDDVKKILEDAASAHAAMAAINYDMSGYTSRTEAQTMLNLNYTRLMDAIKLLKEKQFTDFINDA